MSRRTVRPYASDMTGRRLVSGVLLRAFPHRMDYDHFMAQRIQTLFIDDLDGGEAAGTVRFGLDGTQYEIDLSAAHSQELREARSSTSATRGERRHCQARCPRLTREQRR